MWTAGVFCIFDNKAEKEYNESNTLVPLYDNEDAVCGIVYNDVPYYFLKNLQGDIIAIADANGTVIARYTYDAWGVPTIAQDTTTVGIATINPFRYRGYYDTEIGMYYLQSRYYDPTVGRFVNGDDVSFICYLNTETIHLFSYCDNNPVDDSDWSGFAPYRTKNKVVNQFMKTVEKFIPNIYSDDFKSKDIVVLRIGTTNLGLKFSIGASIQTNKNALFGGLFKRGTLEASAYLGITNDFSFSFSVGINWKKAYLKTGFMLALPRKTYSGLCLGFYIELSIPTWLIALATVAAAIVSVYVPAVGACIVKVIATIRKSLGVAAPVLVPLLPRIAGCLS